MAALLCSAPPTTPRAHVTPQQRHRADNGRHRADEPAQFAGVRVGTVSAAFIGIFSAGQQIKGLVDEAKGALNATRRGG